MKETITRDLIPLLKTIDSPVDSPIYVRHSDKMAKLAGDYYNNLQNNETEQNIEAKIQFINTVLQFVKWPLNDDKAAKLKENLSKDNTRESLQSSAKHKASGVDGIMTDFYQKLDNTWTQVWNIPEKRERGLDIVQMLTLVYNDIENHGLMHNTELNTGWMCPIYKNKGDPAEIQNYRPITVLNADYKIYTKARSIQLMEVAPEMIHRNQAGFMKNRRITDHILQNKMLVELAEKKKLNVMIFVLDQEKAYDRISHCDLWHILDNFSSPKKFTDIVKAM